MFVTSISGSGKILGLEHRVHPDQENDSTAVRSLCSQRFLRYSQIRSKNDAYRDRAYSRRTQPDPRITDEPVGDADACQKCDEIYQRLLRRVLPLLPASARAHLSDLIDKKDS